MQTAETLLSVIRQRGKEEKPLSRMYRHLYNRELYEVAYSQMYANKGAMTPGTGKDTLDGTSLERFDRTIERLQNETYRWQPVRRTYIPKKSGGKRPLGMPGGDDKILQGVVKLLLEAYYEPQFSERSHGFRPNKGCHTALKQISQKHRDVSWFIEGDIKGFFDNIDQEVLLDILAEHIQDGRFLNLIKRLMQAGYVEDWKWNATLSGTPQGGIISPLLANIYLNRFDQWVENELMPLYNTGSPNDRGRKRNPEYRAYEHKKAQAKKKGDAKAYKHYDKLMKSVPSIIDDEGYRKLEYVRYADDFLLSFAGPKKEAEDIKVLISNYLERELNLELSMEKTLITHARTEKARFLSYEVCVMQSNDKQTDKRRSANGQIWLGVPKDKITAMKAKYMEKGKVIHRPEWLLNSDYDIIANFQAEYRGFVQYYVMAHNIEKLTEIRWVAESSLLKTLAGKFKSTSNKMLRKYKGQMEVNGRTYKVIKVEVEREDKKPLSAHFGALPLKRNSDPHKIVDDWRNPGSNRSELIQRLRKDECEMCGNKGETQVHHVRKLKDLTKKGRKTKPTWVKRMAALRRKTLIVCIECHQAIHRGEHRVEWDRWNDLLASGVN